MERFALQQGIALRKDGKFQALVGRKDGSAWLMLPQSFMNASGRPVQMLAGFFKIPAAEILVVHDEIEFPAGVARPMVDKVSADLAKALSAQNVKSRLGDLGVETKSSTPEEFGAFMGSEAKRWGKLIQEAGLKIE